MKYYFLYIIILFNLAPIFGQNNSLVINDNAFVVMDGGVFIVVDQPHQNGIITTGTGGNIISEDETNKIRWEIATNTGTYTVPFTTTPVVQGGNGVKIPYSLEIQAAGVGANAHIDLSTYETATDMNTPWASMVTQMNDADIASFDNSLHVVDRFWIIDADSYTTKPDPNMQFGYDDSANEIGGTNTLVEINLVAQRFNDAANTWEGDFSNSFNFWGTVNTGSNFVHSVDVPVADFFSAWVLVNKLSILPVALKTFNGNCFGANKIEIKWSTLSESNNDFYTLEKSANGINWEVIKTINSNGNTIEESNYSVTDFNPNPTNYYKLYQTDFDGKKTELKEIVIDNCKSDKIDVFSNDNNTFNISINSLKEKDYSIYIYDMRGRQVNIENIVHVQKGENNLTIPTDLSYGIYSIVVESESKRFVKKIVLN